MSLRGTRIKLSRAVGALHVVRVLGRWGRREVGEVTPTLFNLCDLLRIANRVNETFMLTAPVALLWLKMRINKIEKAPGVNS